MAHPSGTIVNCPNCGRQIAVNAASGHTEVQCPSCQRLLTINRPVSPAPRAAMPPSHPPSRGRRKSALNPVYVGGLAVAAFGVAALGVLYLLQGEKESPNAEHRQARSTKRSESDAPAPGPASKNVERVSTNIVAPGKFSVEGGISNARVLSDGKSCVIVDKAGQIGQWSLESCKKTKSIANVPLISSESMITGLAVNGPGDIFGVSVVDPGSPDAYLIDRSGKTVLEVKTPDVVYGLAFHPSKNEVAFAGDSLRLWDVGSRKEKRVLATADYSTIGVFQSVAFSNDGDSLIAGNQDGAVMLFDLKGDGMRTLKGHRAVVWSVCISNDRKIAASGDQDGTVIVWDLTGGTAIKNLRLGSTVLSLAFDPSDSRLAAGSMHGFQVFETKTWTEVKDGEQPDGDRVDQVWGLNFLSGGAALLEARDSGVVTIHKLREK